MNLGGSQAVKSLSLPSSIVSRKSGDGVSDQFPAGLRVLVVDDDPTFLRILEKMLKNCLYEVTKCNRAELALSYLRENKNGYDIVISDVHMPDMDGFKFLEYVGLEMDLPVIMMSADDSKKVVMKGCTHGAVDYLIKPVRIEALKNIWQHVVRKKKYEYKGKDYEQTGSVEDGEQQQKPPEDAEYLSSANEGNWKNPKKRKDEEDEAEERDDTSTLKKPRVVWSVELHQQFVTAVNHLGLDKAVPKKILELMNVRGLTRENVASHLQKYRLYLRRLSSVSQHQSGLNNAFMGPTDATFGLNNAFMGPTDATFGLNNAFMGSTDATFVPMSPLNGIDLQALPSSGMKFDPSSLRQAVNAKSKVSQTRAPGQKMGKKRHRASGAEARSGPGESSRVRSTSPGTGTEAHRTPTTQGTPRQSSQPRGPPVVVDIDDDTVPSPDAPARAPERLHLMPSIVAKYKEELGYDEGMKDLESLTLQALSIARGISLKGVEDSKRLAVTNEAFEARAKRIADLEAELALVKGQRDEARGELRKARDETGLARDEAEELRLELERARKDFEEGLAQARANAVEDFKKSDDFSLLQGDYAIGSYFHAFKEARAFLRANPEAKPEDLKDISSVAEGLELSDLDDAGGEVDENTDVEDGADPGDEES